MWIIIWAFKTIRCCIMPEVVGPEASIPVPVAAQCLIPIGASQQKPMVARSFLYSEVLE